MNLRLLNPLRWRKSFLFSIAIGFLLVWFTFLDTYSLLARYQLQKERDFLIEETKRLSSETETLNAKIQKLEDNPELIERIAREDYGMRKPGETVYRLRKD